MIGFTIVTSLLMSWSSALSISVLLMTTITSASHSVDNNHTHMFVAQDSQMLSNTSSTNTSVSATFVLVAIVLALVTLFTIIGNVFVIAAIVWDKNLRTSANQLVVSLAVADLMVACLVMPLGAYNELYQGWYLSTSACEFWTSADVLCCTASILNLLAIAIDRYWAVTRVDYMHRRTRKRIASMIVCAWTVGAVVSLAPIFGWKDSQFTERVLVQHKCLVSQDVAYQLFATISTFYVPLTLLLILYWKIYQRQTNYDDDADDDDEEDEDEDGNNNNEPHSDEQQQPHSDEQQQPQYSDNMHMNDINLSETKQTTTTITTATTTSIQPSSKTPISVINTELRLLKPTPTLSNSSKGKQSSSNNDNSTNSNDNGNNHNNIKNDNKELGATCRVRQRRQAMEMKRERKAAKTLAIITGAFVGCWLPFFVNAVLMPTCGEPCTPSDVVLSILLWFGYLNSMLNPIIYTIFSPDFRRAFRRLLCVST
ncbi:hypothetical protein GZH46_00766, partial [Fragariocoptes setiger]